MPLNKANSLLFELKYKKKMIPNEFKALFIRQNVFLLGALLLGLLSCGSKSDDMAQVEIEEILEEDEGPVATGCPETEYDDWKTSEYVLPYPVGESYIVTLSHCGGSYHGEGQPDQFAIDFSMEIGTLISAARAGRVIYVEESGVDGDFPNNLVVIKHEDDTYAQYMHLTQNGALVRSGEEVDQGQAIGLSGNTGLAGFPHLHFIVTEEIGYPYVGIPTTFSNTLSNERSLARTVSYPAYSY